MSYEWVKTYAAQQMAQPVTGMKPPEFKHPTEPRLYYVLTTKCRTCGAMEATKPCTCDADAAQGLETARFALPWPPEAM